MRLRVRWQTSACVLFWFGFCLLYNVLHTVLMQWDCLPFFFLRNKLQEKNIRELTFFLEFLSMNVAVLLWHEFWLHVRLSLEKLAEDFAASWSLQSAAGFFRKAPRKQSCFFDFAWYNRDSRGSFRVPDLICACSFCITEQEGVYCCCDPYETSGKSANTQHSTL